MKPSDFATRDKANEGVVRRIPGPDGRLTDETMTIHSSDCDAFRRGKAKILSRGMEIASMPEGQRDEARERMNAELAALCVSGWTLDEPFSHEACAKLLYDAPYLVDFVTSVADDRKAFFASGSGNSSNTQGRKPGSKSAPRTARRSSGTSSAKSGSKQEESPGRST